MSNFVLIRAKRRSVKVLDGVFFDSFLGSWTSKFIVLLLYILKKYKTIGEDSWQRSLKEKWKE